MHLGWTILWSQWRFTRTIILTHTLKDQKEFMSRLQSRSSERLDHLPCCINLREWCSVVLTSPYVHLGYEKWPSIASFKYGYDKEEDSWTILTNLVATDIRHKENKLKLVNISNFFSYKISGNMDRLSWTTWLISRLFVRCVRLWRQVAIISYKMCW